MEATFLLVCEGPTDYKIFKAIAEHLSAVHNTTLSFIQISPQIDATSGTTREGHGFGQVLNWCKANKDKVQMFLDFNTAKSIFIQMDTDIAMQIDPAFQPGNQSARQCCENKLNGCLEVAEEPLFCRYILPTQNTETWLLACYDKAAYPDIFPDPIDDYEMIPDVESRLIGIGYPRKGRKLKKDPKKYEKEYAPRLVDNLPTARSRCRELERLCNLLVEKNPHA